MKHIGIITEYNPFHNGHHYQLKTAKQLFPEKKIIIMMSGDFVQRGEPAIFHKYLRTKCALQCSADIVFELPAFFAASSAEHFASAAVLALAKTGVIDTLCFGAEHDDLESFERIAKVFVDEPADYQSLLKKHLKSGLSYPKARASAIGVYFQNEQLEKIVSYPNNILGIEYLKAIYRYHLDLNPVIIKRQGSNYHDITLENPLSSATALREELTNFTSLKDNETISSKLKPFMPDTSYQLLKNDPFAKPVFLSDFYLFLQCALWNNQSSYEDYFEVSKDLSNQLSAFSAYPSSVEELIKHLAGKNYTNTRIKRALLNILFGQTKQNMSALKENEYLSYLRLLGFRSDASFILKEMKDKSKLPVITKMADAKKTLSQSALINFQKDIHISNLYKQVFFNKYRLSMPSEYEQSVIIERETHRL